MGWGNDSPIVQIKRDAARAKVLQSQLENERALRVAAEAERDRAVANWNGAANRACDALNRAVAAEAALAEAEAKLREANDNTPSAGRSAAHWCNRALAAEAALAAVRRLCASFDPTSGSGRARAFVSDLLVAAALSEGETER